MVLHSLVASNTKSWASSSSTLIENSEEGFEERISVDVDWATVTLQVTVTSYELCQYLLPCFTSGSTFDSLTGTIDVTEVEVASR